MKNLFKHRPLFLLFLPLLLSLACSFSSKNADENNPSETTNMPVAPTSEKSGTVRFVPTTEGGSAPTSLPAIASSSDNSDSSDDPFGMRESIFIQDERNLVTTILFENRDTSGVEDIEYTVTASDAEGVTLKTETGYIDFMDAGSHRGVASQMFLEEGQLVTSVNVEWTYYQDATGSDDTPFTFDKTRYYYDTYWDRFTAVMTNNSDITYSQVRVDVVAYDSAGTVIGGGYTYVEFIPANEKIGVSILGFVSETPATMEFFPRTGALSQEITDDNIFQDVSIIKTGFFFKDTTLGGGFLVQNNTEDVLKSSQYYLTIYEEDGTVAQTSSGPIQLIWPGQTLGVSPGQVILSEGANPTEFDVFVLPGSPEDQDLTTNPLTVQKASFLEDQLNSRVSVTIANAHTESIDNPFLTVLLYNAQDEIIGGGFSYPDPIPANGTLTVEIFVTHVADEVPARVEAFPTVSNW